MATTNSSRPSSARVFGAATAGESSMIKPDASNAGTIADPIESGPGSTSDEAYPLKKPKDCREALRVPQAPVLGRPPTPVDDGRSVKDMCLDGQSRYAPIPAALLSCYRGESRLRSIAPAGVGVDWAHPNDIEHLKREWYTIWLDTSYPEKADPWGFSSASNSRAVTPVGRGGGTEH